VLMIRSDITESMIAAAIEFGKKSGALAANARQEDVRRLLAAALGEMSSKDRGPAYPLWVNTSVEHKRARFVGVTEQRAYFRVETEDGKSLIVHANCIEPASTVNHKGRA
jgi:hypothetical protein